MFNNIQIRFLLLFIVCYLILSNFFKFWIGLCAPGGLYWHFADEYLNFIKYFRHFLIWGSGLLCELFNLMYLTNDTSIRIVGHGGIRIVYGCLGFDMMSMIMALAIAIPKQKLKNRFAIGLIGVASFSLLNILRLFVVSYYAGTARELMIDHHDIFNYICYIIIIVAVFFLLKHSAKKITID
jgi:exosortase/archaeosortase family protein